MKPYYDDGNGIVIYNADCREVLPTLEDNAADITFTSPPYNTLPTSNTPTGIHGPKGGRGKWVAKASSGYADSRDEGEYQEWIRWVVAECLRVSQGLVWVNHKVRFRDGTAVHPVRFLPFPIYSEVIWDRGGSMALNCQRFAPSHEVLLAFGDKHYWDNSENTAMTVWRIAPQRSESHPCPFPVAIASKPIKSSCPAGGIVLDPFMGSGTTLRAAKDLGCRAIGIEIEERYCEIAARRLAQGVLFGSAP